MIDSYGFNRTTIYKWFDQALRSRAGVAALGATVGTGRPRVLTPKQEQQRLRWVDGRDARQYGLDFGRWTRAVVADLIERTFGLRPSVTSVGALLARLGLSPQKPLQRAYQRDAQAIERWQHEHYPRIAAQARHDGAEILFWNESGFRADAGQGKTHDRVGGRLWGVRG